MFPESKNILVIQDLIKTKSGVQLNITLSGSIPEDCELRF